MTSLRTGPLITALEPAPNPAIPPLYWRFLRLHNIRPNGWQRALGVEGMFGVAIVLTLADVASSWTLIALPLASFVVVKAQDLLAGLLPNRPAVEPLPPPQLMDYVPFVVPVVVILVLKLTVHGTGETAIVLLAYGIDVTYAVLVYRYLLRRGSSQRTAVGIAVATLVLSPLAGILGAALEARRRRLQAG